MPKKVTFEVLKREKFTCISITCSFLPRDAMHARYYPLACVYVTSQCSPKTAKHRITQTIVRGLYFSGAKDLREIRPESPHTWAPNAIGVG